MMLVLNTQKKKRSNYEGIIDSYLQVLLDSNKNRLNLDLSFWLHIHQQIDGKFKPPHPLMDGKMERFGFRKALSLISGEWWSTLPLYSVHDCN